MTRHAPQLKWCIAKLGQDMNWWVSDISDKERWDLDELSIVDPRQIHHILDLLEPLREYGLQPDVVEDAFFVFRIAKEEGKAAVRLERISDSIFDTEEKLFCLPDVIDEEKGAYADFLDHVTKLRVQMLNDLIDFEENLTIEELEEDIREQLNEDYMEGRNTPFFQEITSILEYIPEGYESELGEEEVIRTPKEEEDFEDALSEFEDQDDGEEIERDATMNWGDEEDEDEEGEEDEAIQTKGRGRKRKS